MHKALLKIIDYGAWNGGIQVDNSTFENQEMFFKGGIPVTAETIEQRIGVRTRMCAPADERIGETALENLLAQSNFDPSRVKLLIAATNVGDDKYDPGPLVQFPLRALKQAAPDVVALDLYSGCPGYNVGVELAFMLSLGGILKKDDISVVVGAENIHRANTFMSGDTSNIIFGDDALATALETQTTLHPSGSYTCSDAATSDFSDTFILDIAKLIYDINGGNRLDGIIVDNQIGKTDYRVPATAARVQAALVQLIYPEQAAAGAFHRFKDALAFYDRNVKSFAFDIMSLHQGQEFVESVAKAYVESGKYPTVASVSLHRSRGICVKIHHAEGYAFHRPQHGIIDTFTQTHGCFGDFIHAIFRDDEIWGDIDGKGVFLYATRGANRHLTKLLQANALTIDDIELLIEHQANFAMIPLTLEQLFSHGDGDPQQAAADFIANKMVTNIHTRGNCSVVCMQRLPYDLQCGALEPDTIQGYAINENLDALKNARLILSDSVGAGMTRSSFLQRL
jgi:3-oxoacyl-[acyl-carrier-protein] synthase III